MIVYTNKYKIPFQIDEEDFERVSQHTWCIDSGGYPCSGIGFSTMRLHEFLMGKADYGKIWDHIDQDKLNNRKENFRLVTQVINQRNRKNLNRNNTTGCTGVQITSAENYMARLKIPGQVIFRNI